MEPPFRLSNMALFAERWLFQPLLTFVFLVLPSITDLYFRPDTLLGHKHSFFI